jgi:hypothetical protein
LFTNRHTHINVDSKNQNFTVRFAGTKKSAGISGGVPTLTVFDEEMRNSFKTGNFVLKRKVGLVHYSDLFLGWLNYSGYGVPKNSADYVAKQGGRDLEAMHIHYFYDRELETTVVQYKYAEHDSYPYIPAQPIKVKMKMIKRNVSISNPNICLIFRCSPIAR